MIPLQKSDQVPPSPERALTGLRTHFHTIFGRSLFSPTSTLTLTLTLIPTLGFYQRPSRTPLMHPMPHSEPLDSLHSVHLSHACGRTCTLNWKKGGSRKKEGLATNGWSATARGITAPRSLSQPSRGQLPTSLHSYTRPRSAAPLSRSLRHAHRAVPRALAGQFPLRETLPVSGCHWWSRHPHSHLREAARPATAFRRRRSPRALIPPPDPHWRRSKRGLSVAS